MDLLDTQEAETRPPAETGRGSLGRLLQSGILALRESASALGSRLGLRQRQAAADETDGESREPIPNRDAIPAVADALVAPTDDAPTDDAPARRPRWLLWGLWLALGALLGGAGVAAVARQHLDRQAGLLSHSQSETRALESRLAHSARRIAQVEQQLAAEQARRIALENRRASLRHPSAESARAESAPRGGDCTLRTGASAATLQDCLSEFKQP